MATPHSGRRHARTRRALGTLTWWLCFMMTAFVWVIQIHTAVAHEQVLEALSASTTCTTANTLVVGATDSDAIAYDAECVARNFRVTSVADTELSLNLSNLNLVDVESYPRVYQLILSHNDLETFAPDEPDNDMEELYLANNNIVDMTTFVLPLRLIYLDLSDNMITKLVDSIPWPEAGLLQTLILDNNSLKSIDNNAFVDLRSLQELSIVSIGISSLDDIVFPASLRTLNASNNDFTSSANNFSNLPEAMQHLDLSSNLLTSFPTIVSSMETLKELNLASNGITKVKGIQFPSTLQTLNMADNPLNMVEICSTAVSIFQALETLMLPSTLVDECSSSHATLVTIQGYPICVLEESYCVTSTSDSSSTSQESSTSSSSGASPLGTTDEDTDSSSVFSSKSVVVLGGSGFLLGLIVYAMAILLYRKRRRDDAVAAASRNRVKSRGNMLSFALEQHSHTDDDADADMRGSWVFESPQHVVAILEEGKRKKHSKIDDLLVYEIPPEEINLKEVLNNTLNTGKKAPRIMLLAEYQGFQVVIHALLRQKRPRKREERHFLEQIRLATTLEHSSIVQFIGLTYGGGSGPLTHNWSLGVVFEYMHNGSMASMFQAERSRREGKLYYQHRSTIGSSTTNIFSWYPAFSSGSMTSSATGNVDWRCKLSIALDVAMGLVYLHASNLVHGCLCANKVLVNMNGEAKLSALDLKLPSEHDDEGMSIRESARMKMRQIIGGVKPVPAPGYGNRNSSYMDGSTPSIIGFNPNNSGGSTGSNLWKARKADIYAFGLFLWELDTMISLDTMKELAIATAEAGEEHHMLKFAADCPREIQYLARRCWNPNLDARPDAIDVQEELVRLLEGRLTASYHVLPPNWTRPTNTGSNVSSFNSSNLSSSSFSSTSALIEAETDI